MTQREFMNAVIAIEGISEEVKTHAENEIAKLDARNAKRATTQSKTQKENEPIIAQIREYLTNATEPMCSAEIAEALELTSNKVASLIKNIEVEVSEKKYNKRKVKAYAIVKGE